MHVLSTVQPGQDTAVEDPFRLQRFVDAQDSDGTFDRAVGELRLGRKRTHWMWFVFPQLTGLGRSPTAQHFAISGLAEAKAYLAHPVLGGRLIQCARIVGELPGSDAVTVFGAVDAEKLRSSMTLFGRADPAETAFDRVLKHYFDGEVDDTTVDGVGTEV
jgi:uncharacterized protein (DUF1810 family)